MHWFIVMMAFANGREVPAVATAVAQTRFPTYRACIDDASVRAAELARLDIHGRYLCMYHGEPDNEMAATAKIGF